MIPLKYEKYTPTGWLGILVNAHLYYDVQTDESLMKNLPEIIKAIKAVVGDGASKGMFWPGGALPYVD